MQSQFSIFECFIKHFTFICRELLFSIQPFFSDYGKKRSRHRLIENQNFFLSFTHTNKHTLPSFLAVELSKLCHNHFLFCIQNRAQLYVRAGDCIMDDDKRTKEIVRTKISHLEMNTQAKQFKQTKRQSLYSLLESCSHQWGQQQKNTWNENKSKSQQYTTTHKKKLFQCKTILLEHNKNNFDSHWRVSLRAHCNKAKRRRRRRQLDEKNAKRNGLNLVECRQINWVAWIISRTANCFTHKSSPPNKQQNYKRLFDQTKWRIWATFEE